MSKQAIPTTPTLPHESEAEYTLRAAATFIRAYAAEKLINIDDYDEPVTGEALAEICDTTAKELTDERLNQDCGMAFTGKIIQAGHDPDDHSGPIIKPTVTILTSESDLKNCKAIPFYQSANILIIPIKPVRR